MYIITNVFVLTTETLYAVFGSYGLENIELPTSVKEPRTCDTPLKSLLGVIISNS